MASPFSVFRKNQKVMIAVLGVLAVVALGVRLRGHHRGRRFRRLLSRTWKRRRPMRHRRRLPGAHFYRLWWGDDDLYASQIFRRRPRRNMRWPDLTGPPRAGQARKKTSEVTLLRLGFVGLFAIGQDNQVGLHGTDFFKQAKRIELLLNRA